MLTANDARLLARLKRLRLHLLEQCQVSGYPGEVVELVDLYRRHIDAAAGALGQMISRVESRDDGGA